jgi:hypothetical protein
VAHAALAAFGPTTWVEGETTFHELARTNGEGTRAVWEWVLEHASDAVQGEWTLGAKHAKLLKRVMADGRCRLLVAGDARLKEHKQGTWLIDHGGERWVHLNEVTRLRLAQDRQQRPRKPNLWEETIPRSAADLMAGQTNQDVGRQSERAIASGEREIRRALAVWPEGDDDLADEMEREHPLAAWIASTAGERGRRWRRIGAVIPDAWIGLHEANMASDVWLSEDASRAMHDERATYALELARRFEQDPTRQPQPEGAPSHSVACTARLLLLRGGEPPAAEDVGTWMDDPLHFETVLPRVWQVVTSLPLREGPRNGPLATWHAWFSAPNAPPNVDTIIRRCEDLPWRWWAPWLPEWLPNVLASARGRRWLEACDLIWPIIATALDGEGPPGCAPPNPRLSFDGRDLSDVHLIEESPQTEALFDLAEGAIAAQEGRPPPLGRTHPEACWLLTSPDLWPTFVGLGTGTGPLNLALRHRRVDR